VSGRWRSPAGWTRLHRRRRSKVATLVLKAEKWVTPHNSFIFIALSGGAIPILLYDLLVPGIPKRDGGARVRTMDGPFFFPLVAYAFLTTQFGGLTFMWPWMLVTWPA
jgi:hypothetical protein